jgi:hypothetical protein
MSFTTGFVIFPNLTQLDFTGPLQVLDDLPGATTLIVAKTREDVSDRSLAMTPTATFADCPPLDLMCIPGTPPARSGEEPTGGGLRRREPRRLAGRSLTGAPARRRRTHRGRASNPDRCGKISPKRLGGQRR